MDVHGEHPRFIGGLVPRTEIILADGKVLRLEDIKVGDYVLTSEGRGAIVEAVLRGSADLVTIRQATNHYAHLRDSTVAKPWGVIEMTCSKRQQLVLRTKQRIKISMAKQEKMRRVAISQFASRRTKDGRIIKTLCERSKGFPLDCDRLEIVEYIEKSRLKHKGRYFDWKCEVDDLQYTNKERRQSSGIAVYTLSMELPILEPWLRQYFEKDISSKELEAMAWLLGFWIGDGHRSGAAFALHSGDHDVNTKLGESAKLWGMELRIKHNGPDEGFEATGYLHTYNGAVRNWNANNPFVKVLEGLRFWENGRRNGKKNIPLFMRIEQIKVRESFLAGLIDSDGSTNIQHGSVRVKIPTTVPLIRDGIFFIARSLGLTVSTNFRGANFNERTGLNESDLWIFHLFGGTNFQTLRSILNRCSCQRKKNPKIQYSRDRDFEEFISDYESADEEEVHGGCTNVYNVRDIMDSFDSEQEEQEEGMFNFARMRFNTDPKGKGDVIGLILSKTSNQTFVTNEQIVCAASQLLTKETEQRVDFKRTCLSCDTEKTSRWNKVPWLEETTEKLCKACVKSYSHTRMRCSDASCNMVFKPSDLNPKRLRGARRIANIKIFCKSCGSAPRRHDN